ncbi:hypothetical protein D8674_030824 [Pyrus ussuriensis x Pyrus communis]|uniref:Uncharacterized protein n=1 Tax=Pyrus ussuriensis x Pyrus communis TaxID=2448454 RepID=A0A5N5F9Z9_9ROSA|nr:hypothetical protein D8674_030824 [Pyrus ussuriensis x Pyrus communis]
MTNERVLKRKKMMKVEEEIASMEYQWNQNELGSEKRKKIESLEKNKKIECLDKMTFLPFKAVTWIVHDILNRRIDGKFKKFNNRGKIDYYES